MRALPQNYRSNTSASAPDHTSLTLHLPTGWVSGARQTAGDSSQGSPVDSQQPVQCVIATTIVLQRL